MKVSEFTGGLNNKIAPSLLPLNAAVSLINSDVTSGVLKSTTDLGVTVYDEVSPYFIDYNSDIVSFSAKTSFEEYAGDLYYVTGGTLRKRSGATESIVGIEKSEGQVQVGAENRPLEYDLGETITVEALGVVPTALAPGDLPDSVKHFYRTELKKGSTVIFTQMINITFGAGVHSISFRMNAPTGLTWTISRLYNTKYRIIESKTTVRAPGFATILDDVEDISAGAEAITFENINEYLHPGGSGTYVDTFRDLYEFKTVNYTDKHGNPQSIELVSEPHLLTHNSASSDFQSLHIELAAEANPSLVFITKEFVDPLTKEVKLYKIPYSAVNDYNDYIVDPLGSDYVEYEPVEYLDGTYQYVTTFYNSASGTESQPSEISGEIFVADGVVTLTGLPNTAAEYDTLRIYRVGGTLTEFSLVDELPSSATIYTDVLSDSNIIGTLLVTETHAAPPQNLTLLTEVNGVMLGAIGSKLHFSEQGVVSAWPGTNFIEIGAKITCIEESANGIIVCTRVKTFVITGNSPANYSKYLVSGEHGCAYDQSFQRLGAGVIFKSVTGLCYTTGGEVQVLSANHFNPLSIAIHGSCVFNNTYYAISSSDIFVYDLTNKNFYNLNYSCSGIGIVRDSVNVLIDNALWRLHGGNLQEELYYISPVFTEGEHSEIKAYKDFYIAINGTFTVSILLDGEIVLAKSIAGRGTFNLKVPQRQQRAIDSQVIIQGYGTVYEYEWKAMGRQNGR